MHPPYPIEFVDPPKALRDLNHPLNRPPPAPFAHTETLFDFALVHDQIATRLLLKGSEAEKLCLRQARSRTAEENCIAKRRAAQMAMRAERSRANAYFDTLIARASAAPWMREYALATAALRGDLTTRQRVERYQQLVQAFPHSAHRASIALFLAKELFTDGQEARPYLRWLVETDTDPERLTWARALLGGIAFRVEDFPTARWHFSSAHAAAQPMKRRLRRVNRGVARLRRETGRMLLRSHLCDPAMNSAQALTAVQRIWPGPVSAETLAEAYFDIGRVQAAIEVWQMLIAADTNSVVGYQTNIMRSLRHAGRPSRHMYFYRKPEPFRYTAVSHVFRPWQFASGPAIPVHDDPQYAERFHRRRAATADGAYLHGFLLAGLMEAQGRWNEAIKAYALSIEARPTPNTDVEFSARSLLHAHRAKLEEKHGPLAGGFVP